LHFSIIFILWASVWKLAQIFLY